MVSNSFDGRQGAKEAMLVLSLVAGYLLIFAARVTDVSLSTMRTLLLVRGKRLQAATIGFFEVSIYYYSVRWRHKELLRGWFSRC